MFGDVELKEDVKGIVDEGFARLQSVVNLHLSNHLEQSMIAQAASKTLSTLALDLVQLFHPNQSDLESNYLVKFIDCCLFCGDQHDRFFPSFNCSVEEGCAILKAILIALPKFPLFSLQSNFLCSYAICFLQFFSWSAKCDFIHGASIIGDFLVDICCISQALERGAIGSVQIGLTADRVDRLTCKYSRWTLSQLREVKLSLIAHVLGGRGNENTIESILLTKYRVAMAVVLAQDQDVYVATSAVFKMNGAANLFRVHDIAEEASNHPVETVQYLLSLCYKNQALPPRAPVRAEVQVAVLKWVCKEMAEYLPGAAKTAIAAIVQTVFGSGNLLLTSANSAILVAYTQLANTLLKALDELSFASSGVLFIQCSKKILNLFVDSQQVQYAQGRNSNEYNSESYLALRAHCYGMMAAVAKRDSSLAAKDLDLVILLFRLLGIEDERIISKLYTVLAELLQAHTAAGT